MRKLFFGVRAVILLLTSPQFLVRLATEHDAALPPIEPLTGVAYTRHQTKLIRLALLYSFVLVTASGGLAWLLGVALSRAVGPAGSPTVSALQVIGGAVLLWATLAVRGHEIATWIGESLAEKVNRWIYQCLYVIGTGLLVLSLAWGAEPCG
jgi:hypothetical protein